MKSLLLLETWLRLALHHEKPNYIAIEDERAKLNERLAELNT